MSQLQTLIIGGDNLVEVPLTDNADDSQVTDASPTMTLYRQLAVDGVAVAGDATLTSASQPWASGDANRKLIVRDVGTDGSDLHTTVDSYTAVGEIEMADTAVKAGTSKQILMSVDNAINVSIAQVGSTNVYQGILPQNVPLVEGAKYWLEVSESGQDYRLIECQAAYRGVT